jgi:preprotein translocase subunit SecD
MRIWRLVAIAAAVALWAGLWSPRLSGAQSPKGAKWCLSFHAVHPALTAQTARERGVPAGYRIYPSFDGAEELLMEVPVLHGGELADAQPGVSVHTQWPIITFRFNAEGTGKFARFTRESIGRPFAIVVDGRVISTPIIQEPILAGEGEISGNFTADEAARLAARMRSPACTGPSA